MKKTAKIIISSVVSLVLVGAMLGLFFGPKKEFSENQNKVLSDFPEISFENIVSHRFSKEFEDYVSDHFPFKENLITLRTYVQKALGYKMIGGAYVGKNRLFLEVVKPECEEFITTTNRLIKNIENDRITTSVILIPTAASIYAEELPSHAPVLDQNAYINEKLEININSDIFINLYHALTDAKSGGNVFYTLDHHWTTYGAFCAYREFCKARGLDTPEQGSYTVESVTDEFRGTLYSKTLDDSMPADSIHKYTKDGVSFRAYFGRSEEEKEYYNSDYLTKKDKYAYFGNENPDLVVLENENAKTTAEIVVVKDSFANCFTPFLAEHYKKVHMIDARFFRGAVSDYVNENENVTDLMIIYNLNALNDNTGIAKLK